MITPEVSLMLASSPRHLVTSSRFCMGVWIAIGIALGVAIGAMYDNIAVGIAIGVALGIALGAWQRRK